MFASTECQLEKYPFGQYVLDFASMQNRPGAKWKLRLVHKTLGEDPVYHAEFDVPSIPGSKLTFTFRVDDSAKGPPHVTFGEAIVEGVPQT